jgi:hypothetical protein
MEAAANVMPSIQKTAKYGRKRKYFIGAKQRKQSRNKKEKLRLSPIDMAGP